MESGTPGRKSTADGWLNRALTQESKTSPKARRQLGDFRWRLSIAWIELSLSRCRMSTVRSPRPRLRSHVREHRGSGDGRRGPRNFEALKPWMRFARSRTPPRTALSILKPRSARASPLQIARLIKANVGLEVAFADMGGWDAHERARATSEFADAIRRGASGLL